MSHYFIADMHFGHNGIHEKFRTQFTSQEEHNGIIHNNILSCGGSNNVLWLLGDTFFKASEFWRLDKYAKAFQKVNIVMGNHCAHSLPRYALQFKNVNVFGVVQKFGLWLTHVPIPDYELYRGNCIHGHLHDKQVSDDIEDRKGNIVTSLADQRYFCVSCENIGYKPISLGDIKAIRGWL
jgi:calcineurin-like phosphoesterase family protein